MAAPLLDSDIASMHWLSVVPKLELGFAFAFAFASGIEIGI